jgi:type I restriction enzyme S subunit
MAYARDDMNGLACSEDVMRVVPNTDIIPSGYLYAFLSSRFGVPLVVSGTYGAIIQHIEPQHLADLPIPRLGKIEEQAHELVQKAAELRIAASIELKAIVQNLEEEIGGGPVYWDYRSVQTFATQIVSGKSLAGRLDAFHYIGYVGEAIQKAMVPLAEINKYARALRPPILKRNKVDGTGIDFLGGRELLKLDQSSEDQIALNTPHLEQFIIRPGMILFQCVGQRYGIFGTPVLANRRLFGRAVTEAVMRLIPHVAEDAGYISTYLATGFGQRLVMQHSAGTSIPVLQEDGASKILIYWPDKTRRLQIHKIALNAWEKRAQAIDLENEALSIVERAIEEGAR